MSSFFALLTKLDPTNALYNILVAGSVFLIIYLWRKFLPSVWNLVTQKNPTIQQIPALVISGLFSLKPALGLPTLQMIIHIITGAIIGALPAIGIHKLLSDLPIPYNGAQSSVNPPSEEKTPLERPSGPSNINKLGFILFMVGTGTLVLVPRVWA